MPRPLRLLVVALVLVVTGGLLSACSSTDTGDKGYVDGDGGITQVPARERKRLDQVGGTTLEGKDVTLDQYAGKVVVLNVWASWCPPCRKEAPTLVTAAKELAGDDVVFLGIDTRDTSKDNGLAYQRTYDVPYSSIFDPSGRALLPFRGIVPINAPPSTIVVDKQGRVAASVIGSVPSKRTLVDLVQDAS